MLHFEIGDQEFMCILGWAMYRCMCVVFIVWIMNLVTMSCISIRVLEHKQFGLVLRCIFVLVTYTMSK